MKNTIGKIRRVKAGEPRIDEFTKADDISKSRGGKLCLKKFKKTIRTDGTEIYDTRLIYKKPTKTNIRFAEQAGYQVEVLEQKGDKEGESYNKKSVQKIRKQ